MLLESPDNVETIIDPKDAAESAGLRYVSDGRPGIRRKKAGTGFSYIRADGSKLTEKDVLKRIKALAIPPAWTEVWICPFSDGHIQATGRDAKGRKQYRYHARFREVRESTKYEHVIAFADALPAIREKVREHMALRGLPREKVPATMAIFWRILAASQRWRDASCAAYFRAAAARTAAASLLFDLGDQEPQRRALPDERKLL